MKNRNFILLEVLKCRLVEVEVLISEKYSAIPQETLGNNEDIEECLRKFMVSILPKVKKANPKAEALSFFFNSLNNLFSFAFSNDLRFFDAFNNGFETIILWNDEFHKNEIQNYLRKYKLLLSHHINLLTL